MGKLWLPLLLMRHLLVLLLVFVSRLELLLLIPTSAVSVVVRVVEAVWVSELCHTGPKYKVRVDEVTGKIVPVTIRSSSTSSSSSLSSSDPFYDHNNVMPSTIIKVKNPGDNNDSNSNETMIVDIDDDDDVVHGDDDHAGDTVNVNSDSDSDGDSDHGDGDGSDYGEGFHNDNLNRNRELGFNLIEDSSIIHQRSFRSKHSWREEFDIEEKYTTEAFIVVNHHHHHPQKVRKEEAHHHHHRAVVSAVDFATKQQQQQQQRSLQQGPPQHPGSDNDDELKEGEFFLKPCLCPGSRWTFPDSYHQGAEDPTIDETIMNENNENYVTTHNYGQFPSTDTVDGSGNNAIGKNEEGEGNGGDSYYYVRENVVESALLLCQVSAAYCGWGNTLAPTVHCYEQNRTHSIASNAWPVICLWYFGVLLICCCTIHGRLAGDYVQDRLTTYLRNIVSFLCNYCCCCVVGTTTVDDSADDSGGFNHRMLHRMTYEDEHINDNTTYDRFRGTTTTSTDTTDAASPPPTALPLYYTPRRRQFERNLWSQLNWMWRHQEYHREAQHRAQGLPPPQLRLPVKRFRTQTTTSGSHGIGFGIMRAATNDDGATTHGMTVGDDTTTDSTTDTTTTTTSSMGNTSDATTTTITTTTKVIQRKNVKNRSRENNRDCDEIDDDEHEFVTFDLGANSTEDDDDNDDPPPDHHTHDDDGSSDADATIALASSKADDDDEQHSLEEEPTCTICFCPFVEGEKIGALSCHHEFHVECLKGWAQRKNACPLCNVRLGRPERPATTTTYDHHHHHHTTHNNNSSSNTDDTLDPTASPTPIDTGTPPPPSSSIGLGRRFIQRLRHVFVDRNNNNNNNTNTAVGDYYTNAVTHRMDRSEIQMVNRVGIIASL